MKTRTTASSNFANIATGVMWGLIVGLLLTATASTFGYGLLGNVTALGDPYYQDTILAPSRAFLPWFCTMLAIALLILLKLGELINTRR